MKERITTEVKHRRVTRFLGPQGAQGQSEEKLGGERQSERNRRRIGLRESMCAIPENSKIAKKSSKEKRGIRKCKRPPMPTTPRHSPSGGKMTSKRRDMVPGGGGKSRIKGWLKKPRRKTHRGNHNEGAQLKWGEHRETWEIKIQEREDMAGKPRLRVKLECKAPKAVQNVN